MGSKLKQARQLRGFSYQQLEEKTGISVEDLRQIERGGIKPDADTIKRLAGALNVRECSLKVYFGDVETVH